MRELEFRDGKFAVPDHVADFLEKTDTYKVTRAEAMHQLNNDLLRRRLDKAQNDVISQHFSKLRGS